jgi:hypothetical protein
MGFEEIQTFLGFLIELGFYTLLFDGQLEQGPQGQARGYDQDFINLYCFGHIA